MARAKGLIIGIDLGGTKIAGGIVSEKGKVTRRAESPTLADKGKAVVLRQLRSVIDDLAQGKRIAAVGIGVPGLYRGTTVTRLPNIKCLDGTDLKRLTNNPAIDTSPACGPDNRLAFVSARHGTPQIFVMGQDGSNPTRVTYRGTHNQTPVWCQNGVNKNLLAFTGRDGTLDIFTLDIGTQEYSRLTQGQGMNKDPAFSPDCRILAFTSDRLCAPGIYLSSTKGNNQVRVVEVVAETVRWHRLSGLHCHA